MNTDPVARVEQAPPDPLEQLGWVLLQRASGIGREQHHEALVFTKVADWSSECEYRFVALTEEDGYLHCSTDDSLRAVVVGNDFPDWQLAGAKRACQKLGSEFFKLHWEHFRPWTLSK